MIDKGQWWEFGQDTGVTPLLFTRSAVGFLMTTESQAYLKKTRRQEAHTVKQCARVSQHKFCALKPAVSLVRTGAICGGGQAQNPWRENRDASEILFFFSHP